MAAVKKFLNNIEKYIIYVVLTALVALMFLQVVARYVFGLAWGWMEQVTRLMFVYVTFAGMSYACKGSEHLRVSFAAEFAPGKHTKTILLMIGDAMLVAVSAYLCYLIFLMMLQCIEQKQVFSGAKFIPVWVMYLAGVLGMGGMAIRTIQYGIIPAIKSIKNGTEGKSELQAAKEGSGE
ncbi:TRAP-type C4-dicarboxylate transport system, small permease component [Oscillibacter sp. PC13]|uniref:TRAP transporter small permease n=1 Tax=Oscillibacter sp. PC13 TaxID=1855299 RepID=UPI0008DEF2AC|nr:TRAP transporter small permease [Oscillibacter sp. PC13]SFQ19726.1 TRAP-type C4-dicarboxylate transport system, small permease component [Oscillibacter sp. PC13]